jgi:hypothetical protein
LLTQPLDFNYTIVNSLNPQGVRGLKILLRATDQLLENKEALLAFRRAAARWERYIRTEITVVIDVDYGTRWEWQGAGCWKHYICPFLKWK